jgi:transposase
MTRRQKDPLRRLTAEERALLETLSRSLSQPAAHVERAKALLAVADGQSYTAAAHAAGRRSGDGVAHLVRRFNQRGLAALETQHGGGPPPVYTAPVRERIVREAQRVPDLDRDGTGTWSLKTLQRALRRAPDGLPTVSTYTIWWVLRDAGWRWQQSRSWCHTGTVWRQRHGQLVEVQDPDTTAKKT